MGEKLVPRTTGFPHLLFISKCFGLASIECTDSRLLFIPLFFCICYNLPSFCYSGSQSMVPGLATRAFASAGNLLEVKIFWPQCRTTRSASCWGVIRENWPTIVVSRSPARDGSAHYSQNSCPLRTTLSTFNNDLWSTKSINSSLSSNPTLL